MGTKNLADQAYKATTPVDPRVLDAMLPYFTDQYGNPHSRTHAYGWEAEKAVEDARKVCDRHTQIHYLLHGSARHAQSARLVCAWTWRPVECPGIKRTPCGVMKGCPNAIVYPRCYPCNVLNGPGALGHANSLSIFHATT